MRIRRKLTQMKSLSQEVANSKLSKKNIKPFRTSLYPSFNIYMLINFYRYKFFLNVYVDECTLTSQLVAEFANQSGHTTEVMGGGRGQGVLADLLNKRNNSGSHCLHGEVRDHVCQGLESCLSHVRLFVIRQFS